MAFSSHEEEEDQPWILLRNYFDICDGSNGVWRVGFVGRIGAFDFLTSASLCLCGSVTMGRS